MNPILALTLMVLALCSGPLIERAVRQWKRLNGCKACWIEGEAPVWNPSIRRDDEHWKKVAPMLGTPHTCRRGRRFNKKHSKLKSARTTHDSPRVENRDAGKAVTKRPGELLANLSDP